MSEVIKVDPDKIAILVWPNEVPGLQGKLLTIIDAAIADPQQRKAIKDLTKQALWDWQSSLPRVLSKGIDSPEFKIYEPGREDPLKF